MEFTIEHIFNVDKSTIYKAWLNSEQHTEMTGGECQYNGDEFTAWDGYILGKNIETKENTFIKQSWRTSEFNEHQEDSILEITLESVGENKSKLTLYHYNLTESDNSYIQGWIDHYFTPMEEYFEQL